MKKMLPFFLVLLLFPCRCFAMSITVSDFLPAPAAPADSRVLEALARIVYWEARGEPAEGQLAVAQVVLNRVASPLFPDTVESVIAQRGQFQPWGCADYFLAPVTQSCYDAAAQALGGLGTLPSGVLWFRADASPALWCGAAYYTTIGGHHFYLRKP